VFNKPVVGYVVEVRVPAHEGASAFATTLLHRYVSYLHALLLETRRRSVQNSPVVDRKRLKFSSLCFYNTRADR
jgi:hypothetical protein